LRLSEHPEGIEIGAGRHVVYDVQANEAFLGAVTVNTHAIVWELDDPGPGFVVRCDRVDFPPGGVAYRHVHPGPGIRRILFGELTIDRDEGAPRTYREGESWLEEADDPVLATASETSDTAFVRVLLLPAEWAGKRTIRYLDPADEEKPKLQRATVLLEEPLAS
jgi:quercetin dioxygenase-like cupin family protein